MFRKHSSGVEVSGVGPVRLFPAASYDVVVVAASAGGVTALMTVLGHLPAEFPAAIVVVQHLAPGFPSHLSDVLGARARLHTKFAATGDRLRAGTIYVAPPDRHLRIAANRRLLTDESERVNYVRPAADPLFASAAATLGSRVLAVVLTGMGRDGARGVQMIKRCQGTVIVQDPRTSDARAMPEAAIQTGAADFVLPLVSIASALVSLVMVPGAGLVFGLTPDPPPPACRLSALPLTA